VTHAAFAAVPLRVLFLGDNGHHQPAERFKQLQPVLASRAIELTYTDKLDDLSPVTLARYDCLVIYANQTAITPAQEQALLDYVASGHGFVPIHCASYCFLNSPKYVELVGAQFKSHGAGVFKETLVQPEHALMKGLQPIESWDETYVHTKHNSNRTVLAERRDEQGAEPYTWVREHGQGRVFYTAWGHDQRTWSHPGFQALIERGIRWAAASVEPELKPREGLPPLRYTNAPTAIPNYLAGQRWGTLGQAFNQMQLPLSPEESARHIVVPAGFESRLWAAEPDILKPICMAWDERGRLWIAETIDYPNELQPPGQGRDRLKICDDTDGDGRADKFTVFADQLSIPTGMVFANGGLILTVGGDTLFLKDTDGDDKADERRVLFTGWSMGDTHATASNLRWGFDNWIWGTVGYSGFDGTVGGRHVKFGMGFFRFKPDGSALEFIRSSNNNTWGLGFSEEGIVFGSTANNNASMYMPIPNRYYEAVSGWTASRLETIADSQLIFPITEQVRQVDWHGRYTAGAGHAFYTARAFPKEYWNQVAFVAEPTAHLLGKFRLEAKGADFVAHNERSFLASTDEWCAPTMAEVGPDGALWVIDWYNYIVQHNPTPAGFKTGKGNAYETPLRDKTHGRIYRVVWAGPRASPPAAATSGQQAARTSNASRTSVAATGEDARGPRRLDHATPPQLVAALRSDNQLWRMHAQRLLVERGQQDVVPALCELVRDTNVDEIGLNTAAIHALWTLHGLGAIEANPAARAAVLAALKHPSPGVRRTAVTVLPRTSEGLNALLNGSLLADADAQVRLASLLTLAEMPVSDAAGAAVLSALQDERNHKDRWIPHAATAAAARHDAGFLKAVLGTISAPASAPPQTTPKNRLANASFENERDGRPLDWRPATHGGRGELTLSEGGRSGGRSARIASTQGADVSWSQAVSVEPDTNYRLSAWIKTENVTGAQGALLNVHELQGTVTVRTPAVTGTKDWTRVETTFNTGDHTRLTINCLFGGWGRSTGTAWFDDVELVASGAGAVLPGALGTAVRIVTGHYAARVPVESVVPTLLALNGASPGLAVPLLDGLAAGWPAGSAPALTASDEAKLAALMKSLPDEARGALVTLAGRWERKSLFAAEVAAIAQGLRAQLADAALPDERRADSARRLIGLDDQLASVQAVLAQVTPLSAPALVSGFIAALAESRLPETGRALIDAFPKFTPAARRVVISTLQRRGEWAQELLAAVEQGALKRTDLAAENWQQLQAHPNRRVAAKARELEKAAGAVSNPDMEAVVQKLLPIAQQKGEPARGKEVFTTTCAVCHRFDGQGAQIGPDLTGIAARPRADVLVDIIDPNRSVEANYRMWNVTTKDGETYSGRLDSETQTSVEIFDTAGQKHIIRRKDIATIEASNLSVMPGGFDQLPASDLAALLEYLAQSAHAETK
jgi:putative membrane-bound dehydrogenase-like protein